MSTSTQTEAGSPSESQQPDMCGRTLADFRILRLLGKGGMGQVYLAEQVSLKRKVALKILRSDTSAETKVKALARFRREAEAVAQATHANIVQVYAYGEAEGMPYMALEYVEGRNLRDYVARKGPPDLLISLSIIRQIAAALQRASELGLVHRDIKPENILLTRKGEVKVADFGLSCWLEGQRPELNLTVTGVTMGTPLYMSPEQVEGKPVDSRTDIYSFGVTCYYMLTGQPPFRGSTAFEVALQHVQKEPESLASIRPDLPSLLCEMVHRMMAKLPENRYQTYRELLRDVARVRESISGATGAVIPPVVSVEPLSVPQVPPPAPTHSRRVRPPEDLFVFDDDSPEPRSTSKKAARSPLPSRAWLIVAVVASLLLAAGSGMALALKDRYRSGPYPGTEKIWPADASVLEGLALPSRREQALRLLVEQALNVSADKVPDKGSFSVCMDLGLFYLEEARPDDAEVLFNRLAALREPAALHLLGQAGKAIVLALRNEPRKSNDLFTKVFTPRELELFLRTTKTARLGPGVVKKLEQGPLAPLLPLIQSPRGREWLGKARLYNYKNGIRDDTVARYLCYLFPADKIQK